MNTKELSIPAFLHDIHGEKASLLDLTLTYTGGLLSLFTVLFLHSQSALHLPWWKLLLLALISADIGAGAIANFTKGTNLYYSGDHKRKSRTIFILTHFIHPAIYLFILEVFSLSSMVLVLFTIGSTLLINGIEKKEIQRVTAAFSLVSGICLLLVLELPNPFLIWFFPLYMLKLFIAFGIRRY